MAHRIGAGSTPNHFKECTCDSMRLYRWKALDIVSGAISICVDEDVHVFGNNLWFMSKPPLQVHVYVVWYSEDKPQT